MNLFLKITFKTRYGGFSVNENSRTAHLPENEVCLIIIIIIIIIITIVIIILIIIIYNFCIALNLPDLSHI